MFLEESVQMIYETGKAINLMSQIQNEVSFMNNSILLKKRCFKIMFLCRMFIYPFHSSALTLTTRSLCQLTLAKFFSCKQRGRKNWTSF